MRGAAAAWLLIAFGSFFAVRGLVRAARSAHRHSHAHAHEDGIVHAHHHDHVHASHVHPHPVPDARSATIWTLFIIFVLGPCEPLVPLMLAPAALRDPYAIAARRRRVQRGHDRRDGGAGRRGLHWGSPAYRFRSCSATRSSSPASPSR